MKKLIIAILVVLFMLQFSKPTFSQSRYSVFLPITTTPHDYAIDCIDQHGYFVECDQ